jgi:sorbitol/mannitol transport system substrate-binding protein
VKLVAERNSWAQVPPGTRYSTYDSAEYRKVAPWAETTLKSINTATPNDPSCLPVPYTGTAQINIPEYADWAFNFGQNFSAAVAGNKSVDEWLQESEDYTTEVMKKAGYIKGG